jgi:hypothetical protein
MLTLCPDPQIHWITVIVIGLEHRWRNSPVEDVPSVSEHIISGYGLKRMWMTWFLLLFVPSKLMAGPQEGLLRKSVPLGLLRGLHLYRMLSPGKPVPLGYHHAITARKRHATGCYLTVLLGFASLSGRIRTSNS